MSLIKYRICWYILMHNIIFITSLYLATVALPKHYETLSEGATEIWDYEPNFLSLWVISNKMILSFMKTVSESEKAIVDIYCLYHWETLGYDITSELKVMPHTKYAG